MREWWLACPLAAPVMPVGWHVDVVDAPEHGGREALGRLEMMGYRPAPVITTASGRLLFLVAAAARRPADQAERGSRRRARVVDNSLPTQPCPETGLWLGGDSSGEPDIVVRRRGVLVLPPVGVDPPGMTRWLVEPDAVRRPLPRAEDVLGPILHACRDMADRRARRSARLAEAVAGRVAAVLGYAPASISTDRAGRSTPPAAAIPGVVSAASQPGSTGTGVLETPTTTHGAGTPAVTTRTPPGVLPRSDRLRLLRSVASPGLA